MEMFQLSMEVFVEGHSNPLAGTSEGGTTCRLSFRKERLIVEVGGKRSTIGEDMKIYFEESMFGCPRPKATPR